MMLTDESLDINAPSQISDSRRRRYQQRHRDAGLCSKCSEPIHKAGMCEAHYRKHLSYKRVNKGGAT
jgi:hypothetical protein